MGPAVGSSGRDSSDAAAAHEAALRPAPRTLRHPGPVASHRLAVAEAPGARHLRLCLEPGRCLRDAILVPLAAHGVHAATARLHGGAMQGLRWCVGGPDPSGAAVAAYSAPHACHAAWLVAANATIAAAADGAPLLHCHAAFVDHRGVVRGGHLLVEDCVVGDPAPTVFVTALDGIELKVAPDAQTGLSLILPTGARLLGAGR